jgi:hypothetical protein
MQVRIALKRLFAQISLKRLVSNNTLGLFVLVRLLTDAVSAVESITKTLFKSFSDSASSSDEINTKGVGKGLQESSTASESASLSTGKSLTDSGSAADTLNKLDFGKNPIDTPVSTDQINSFAMTKLLTNSVGVTDDLDGQAVPDDDQTIQFVKARSEVAYVAESTAFSYGKPLSDSFAAAEAHTYSFGKISADTAVSTEALSYAGGKSLTDSSAVTEATVIAFTRPLSDGSSAAEADVKSFGKSSSDSASSSDSGTLLNQDYVDNPYYFADDYVGAKRTF